MFPDEPIVAFFGMLALIFPFLLTYIFGVTKLSGTSEKKKIGYFFTITGSIGMIGILIAFFFKNLTIIGFSISGVSILSTILGILVVPTYKKFKRILTGKIKFTIKPVTKFLFGDPYIAIGLALGTLIIIGKGASPQAIFWVLTGSIILIIWVTFISRDE